MGDVDVQGAVWRGPVPNVYSGRPRVGVRLVVVHIMAGTLDGTDAWFHNPSAQASADFGTGKDGRLYQWVRPAADTAWAQASYNPVAISIENEGQSGDSLTDGQLQRCAEVLAYAHSAYGVPITLTDDPNGAGLITHSGLGVAGGNHPDCPGAPISTQRAEIVRRAQALVPSAMEAGTLPVIAQTFAPFNVDGACAALGCKTGGAWMVTQDGHVYAVGGAPYNGAPAGEAYWTSRPGRKATALRPFGTNGYTVLTDQPSEHYDYDVKP